MRQCFAHRRVWWKTIAACRNFPNACLYQQEAGGESQDRQQHSILFRHKQHSKRECKMLTYFHVDFFFSRIPISRCHFHAVIWFFKEHFPYFLPHKLMPHLLTPFMCKFNLFFPLMLRRLHAIWSWHVKKIQSSRRWKGKWFLILLGLTHFVGVFGCKGFRDIFVRRGRWKAAGQVYNESDERKAASSCIFIWYTFEEGMLRFGIRVSVLCRLFSSEWESTSVSVGNAWDFR